MAIIVIIHSGPIKHEIVLTTEPFLIGRSSACDLKLVDSMISGQHLTILIGEDGRATIKDLETTNGTLVNGLTINEAKLSLEDQVEIGELRMKLSPKEMNPEELSLHTSGIDEKSAAGHVKEELIHNSKGIKTRVLENAKRLKNKNITNDQEALSGLGKGQVFDLEESSGHTKMLKVEKVFKKKNSKTSK